MVSIIMSTYNGTTYLEEQLDSIRLQTRPADEVVISDDCSKDQTVEAVKAYIQKYDLENWSICRNETNCGWEKNFMQGIEKTRGDLLFFADQDDIWEAEKLEKMCAVMEQHPEISVLASDYTPFYMDAAVDKARNEEKMQSDGTLEQYPFDTGFLYVHRPGCVYCTRRSFAEKIKSYWFEKYPHDALFWRYANLTGGLYLYHEPLIRFRRHANNASSVATTGLAKKTADAVYYVEVLKKLEQFIKEQNIILSDRQKRIIGKVIRYSRYRLRFLKDHSLLCGIRLIRYLDCYYAPKTWISDWIIVLFKKEMKR